MRNFGARWIVGGRVATVREVKGGVTCQGLSQYPISDLVSHSLDLSWGRECVLVVRVAEGASVSGCRVDRVRRGTGSIEQ